MNPLVDHARADWAIVLRGLGYAGRELAAPDPPKPVAMAQRMVARWAADGTAALAWSGGADAELPVALTSVARAFDDDADRAAATVALFLEAARRAADVADQLALAAPIAAPAGKAARRLVAALYRARVRPFRPHRRRDADFDRVRAVGYVAVTPIGRVVEVRAPGLAWRGHVLRKADVIISERAEIVGVTT